jgi:predicted metal-binding membrane protein
MTTYAASRRTTHPSDPAPAIWALAGIGWGISLLLVVSGGASAGFHDWVLEQSQWPLPQRLTAFLGVWTVMLAAMMLPTTVAMARMFTAVSAHQARPGPARAAFYGAYLAVWSGFALAALAGDTVVHRAVDASAWLQEREVLVLGAALAGAGAYQLSPLKDACLRACRTPLGMITQHYGQGVSGGWRVGVRHGLNCLGCCWALMLAMFATGVGSLLWMIGLTAVMVAEKTAPWGYRMVRPVAVVLVGAGAWVSLPAFLS